MAANPLQQMIPQVLQMVMQNPQMLQQIMQQAGPLLQMAGLAPSGQTASDATMMQGLPAVGGHIQSGNPVSVGRAYPLVSGDTDADLEDSMIALDEELRSTQKTPTYPHPPAMTPDMMQKLQGPYPGKPDYYNDPQYQDILTPDYEEPIAQLQPGLLSRLAGE